MAAQAKDHYYTSGRRFFIAQCDECLTVLNSGHHYPDTVEGQRLVTELVGAHNGAHHGEVSR